MIVGILLAPEAEEQVRIIDAWWQKVRTAAPNLFSEELAAAFTVLGAAPEAGQRYRHPTVVDVRRILLRSTRYHLYYKIHETPSSCSRFGAVCGEADLTWNSAGIGRTEYPAFCWKAAQILNKSY